MYSFSGRRFTMDFVELAKVQKRVFWMIHGQVHLFFTERLKYWGNMKFRKKLIKGVIIELYKEEEDARMPGHLVKLMGQSILERQKNILKTRNGHKQHHESKFMMNWAGPCFIKSYFRLFPSQPATTMNQLGDSYLFGCHSATEVDWGGI